MKIQEAYADARTAGSQEARASRPLLADLEIDDAARRFLLILAAAFATLRIWAAFVVPFTDTTEARYAEIARKMVETGNWLTPQFEYGVPFWGKPPLHTWLSAAGMEAFGIHEAAARLPIMMTALAVLALVWIWVRDLVGTNAAAVATVMLATMAMFFGASAFVMTDMPMVMGIVLVMIGFWQTMIEGDRRWGYAIFLGLAIGMLAKGPVAVILCVIPMSLWLTLTGHWRQLRNVPWLGGTAMMAALVLPWYIAAEIATPGFLRYFLIGEHVQRFLTPGWQGDLYGSGHQEAKGTIWMFWLTAALPWSLIPFWLLTRAQAVARAFRQDRSGWLAYLLLWALSPLLLFTPASNILAAYVLPGLPAAAILMTVLVVSAFGSRPGRAARIGFSTASSIIFSLFVALTAATVLAPQAMHLKSDKGLVAAAEAAAPGAPLYTIGGRSYSAEFYSRGQGQSVAADAFGSLSRSAGAATYSVPPQMADEAERLGLRNIGAYGRHILFVGPGQGEAPQ